MIKVKSGSCSSDLEVLFQKSDVLTKVLSHTPFIVFNKIGQDYEITMESQAVNLLKYEPDTLVIVQWMGEWRSDFFQMTVKDVSNALESPGLIYGMTEQEIKNCTAVLTLGPKGGFRCLDIDTVNQTPGRRICYGFGCRQQAYLALNILKKYNVNVSEVRESK